MEALWDTVTAALTKWGPMVIAAVATLIIGWIVARTLAGVLRRVMARANVDATLIGFLGSLFYIGLMTLVIIASRDSAAVSRPEKPWSFRGDPARARRRCCS